MRSNIFDEPHAHVSVGEVTTASVASPRLTRLDRDRHGFSHSPYTQGADGTSQGIALCTAYATPCTS